ncbi:MAG: EF-P lysine aminoacylase GenX [Syntrophobacterales bacterium CG_4_8_14_3_um_filter_49_14]|nr:MAG: EF-P lysine aminoacylase GenX [Syntrophobacterales bacterium CG23_combo_of_CG06-09_8_20_14_all_48_27]PJC74024.1 MAG: EF-P lysine aminoacylase GenX [Syntrophobacterales bacterium CG_4_8_14_3_um_filter_49_14]
MEDGWVLARRQGTLWTRAGMIQAVRRFFSERCYLEVETPYRITAPVPEYYIDAVASGNWFLHTSPELCMKRLLAAGYLKIFQICKCFREGERGSCHLPEFTMLEWYHQGIDYRLLMEECEELVAFIASDLGCGEVIPYRGKKIALQMPWERLSVREAFECYAPLSLGESLERKRFDEIMACYIAPHLGERGPTFLYDYPLYSSVLTRTKRDDPSVEERCELYIGGMEVANGSSELADVDKQQLRFEKARQFRRLQNKMDYPAPERFLEALPAMPEAAGMALGVDRLAMIFTDSPAIDDVVTFTPEYI